MQSYALWLVLLWVNTVAPQQALPVEDTVVIELRDSRLQRSCLYLRVRAASISSGDGGNRRDTMPVAANPKS
jgi:hypothetical protein